MSTSMNSINMRVSTPELLWHGGGAENGKPDPVLSVDIYNSDVLVTAGIDENIPPKGSIRLWKFGDRDDSLEFLVDLSDHQSVINVVRFSPCGTMLATASDRQIIVYSLSTVQDGSGTCKVQSWGALTDPKMVERIWLRPCLQEIYDLEWSPDSVYVIAGSIDCKGEIMRVLTRDSLSLRGHSSYVQGVAWDPLNKMVVTQSADRSCKVHQLKTKATQMVKLANKGHHQIRNSIPYGASAGDPNHNDRDQQDSSSGTPNGQYSGDHSPSPSEPVRAIGLYADSTVPCFFRRPMFSPDGSLLITPAGIYRPTTAAQTSHPATATAANVAPPTVANTSSVPSFCTHVYLRDQVQSPIVSLVGLEDPSVAVRCNPLLYELIGQTKDDNTSEVKSLFGGPYRMVFAVVTTSSVLVYDTQHLHPIARIGGCHLATINDAAWSKDGNSLIFCSSDGYLTFVRFDKDALGKQLSKDKVPIEVKQAFPHIYDYVEPVEVTKPTSQTNATSTTTASAAAHSASAVTEEVVGGTLQSPSPASATQQTANSTESAASTSSQQKKKRRITPLIISPLTNTSGAPTFYEQNTHDKIDTNHLFNSPGGPLSQSSPATASVATTNKDSSTKVEHSGKQKELLTKELLVNMSQSAAPPLASVAPAAKKTKKRIAPTLLTTL